MTQRRSLKRFRTRWALAVALAFCSFPAFPQSQTSSPPVPGASGEARISVRTELVLLPVGVTDSSGDFVSGLALPDFRVYQDGHLQDLTWFQQEDTPVTVGLIVDHSRSMGPKLSQVAAAVSAFAQSSNPQDEMFVVDFNDRVSVELLGGKPFTNNARELEKAVSAVTARGRTSLYDAVAEGLLHVQLGRWDKKALIVVSDGEDNASRQKYSQIRALAQQSQVVIYSVVLADPDDEEDGHPNVLPGLSKETGGMAFFPKSLEGVADISKTIARDLREQYTLGFIPAATDSAGSYREIRVKVTAPGRGSLHVRTRSGYFKLEPQPEPAHQNDQPPAKPAKPAKSGKGAS
jgi:Ca-activated chloride channel family protein